MSIHKMSEGKLISHMERVFDNLQASEFVREAIEEYGFDDAEIGRGMRLLDTLRDTSYEYRTQEGRKQSATEEVNALLDATRDMFTGHRDLCRREMEGQNGPAHRLELVGRQTRGRDEWIRTARTFYRALHEDDALRAPAERRGLTAEVAKEGLDAVRDLARANNRQSRLMAAVHDLSEERQIAREAVLEWASDFHFYVQRALDGDDQLREQFDQHVP